MVALSEARRELVQGGGTLYPFRHGYARLADLLEKTAPDPWRPSEAVLGALVMHLQGLYDNAMMAMFGRLLRLEDARVAGQQAISCYREDGHSYPEHFIHIHLADLDVVDGRLRRAARGLARPNAVSKSRRPATETKKKSSRSSAWPSNMSAATSNGCATVLRNCATAC